MMNYDPNLAFCGNVVHQTVRLTFGMWEYRAEKETIVAGNCLGLEEEGEDWLKNMLVKAEIVGIEEK